MNITEAIKNIGKRVHVCIPNHYIDSDYVLIKIRHYKKRGCYSAVCQDTRARSLMICPIEAVEEIIPVEEEAK